MNTTLSNIELQVLSLYAADYSAKLHVREISRLLKANHRTISLALQRLEKYRAMDSVLVGKSRQYYLKLDNSITKEFMKSAELYKNVMLLTRNVFIKKLMDTLSVTVKTTPLILFGSYAQGKEGKGSDIDIAIIKDGNESQVTRTLRELATIHNRTIHLQTFSKEQFEKGIRSKDHLVIEIIKSHVILNNSEYFVDVLWRYFHER